MIRIIRILRRLLVAQSLSAFALLFVATGGSHGASIDADRPTVLITGSNRGIGLAFVQHYVAEEQTLGTLDAQTFHDVMAVNVLAPMKVAEAFADHVAASSQKKIVSITSGAGSVSRETVSTGGAYYGISKTALNMAMRKVGAELADRGIIVALVAPGPTVTDMLQTNRPSLVPRANTSEDAAVGMAAVIARLDASYDGRPLSYDGSTVAW